MGRCSCGAIVCEPGSLPHMPALAPACTTAAASNRQDYRNSSGSGSSSGAAWACRDACAVGHIITSSLSQYPFRHTVCAESSCTKASIQTPPSTDIHKQIYKHTQATFKSMQSRHKPAALSQPHPPRTYVCA